MSEHGGMTGSEPRLAAQGARCIAEPFALDLCRVASVFLRRGSAEGDDTRGVDIVIHPRPAPGAQVGHEERSVIDPDGQSRPSPDKRSSSAISLRVAVRTAFDARR
jgi:hypothetical protein